MLKVIVDENQNAGSEKHGSQVNPDHIFELKKEKDNWLINNDLFSGDIVRLNANQYHVIWENRSYNIEVIDSNTAEKTFQLLINGQHFTTTVRDQFDLLLEGMGMQAKGPQKINNIKAPMPGLIQSIAVSVGDNVSKGDTLLVLVAMKMENVIKSSGEGIVKSLKITTGQIVEKNQVMLEFQ